MKLLALSRGVLTGLAVALCSCATTGESARPPTSELLPGEGTPSAVTDEAPETKMAPPIEAPPPRSCDMFVKPGVLRRASLIRLLDAGLPRWLQGVEGDRALANHRFQGWLVKSIYPDDPCYKELDLRAGDVVQKVNGRSIERPEHAFDVAESLRTAPRLTVDYLRDGKTRQLSIEITSEL
jgi:hypothetical protein